MNSISTLAMPDIANHMGIVHGGEIVKMMDNAAGVAAARFCSSNVVTAHIETDFKSKITLGEYIRAEAEVVFTGKSSIITNVKIWSEGLGKGCEKRLCAEGYFVMIAVDNSGHPVPVKQIGKLGTAEAKKAEEIYCREK